MSKKLYSLILASIAISVLANPVDAKDGMVNFNSKNVSFSYPMSMGSKFSSKKVKAYPLPSPDEKPDDVAPEHWEITFAKTNARVYVFPTSDTKVKDYKTAYPPVADAVKDLGALLKNKSAAPTDIPVLPWMDASSPFLSHVKYVPFKSGTGVRYLATYQIEPEVVSNDGLIYSMQGLSADGKYYVSAMIPVKTKTLPEKSDVATWSKEKYDTFSKNFASYSKKQKAKMDKLADTSFTPTLAELDTLVETIKVQ